MEFEMKTRSIRADEATLDKFKTISEDFDNQGDCLSTLVEVYEVSKAKHVLVDMQTNIADYESHMSALNQAFLHVLELNSNAEQRIRQEFTMQLTSKDKLIEGLQERSETAEALVTQTKQEFSGQLQNAVEEIDSLKKALSDMRESLSVKERECSQYEKSISDKQIIIDSLNARISDQIEIEKKLAEHEANLKLSAESSAKKDAELSSLKEQVKSGISQIEQTEKNKALELKAAIYDTKIEYQKIIDEEKEKYQKTIDEEKEKHQKKLDMYMDKLEKSQEKVAKLQDIIGALQQKNVN